MDGAVLDSRLDTVPRETGSGTAASLPGQPLKVGALVDLTLTPDAGGHVKCWERIAETRCDGHAECIGTSIYQFGAIRG